MIYGYGDGWAWSILGQVKVNGTFRCKGCIYIHNAREKRKKYYRKHIEAERKKGLDYYYEHREEALKQIHKYYLEHQEEKKAKRRKYGKTHREEEREYHKQWKENNPEKWNVIMKRGVAKRKRELGFHPISLPLDVPFDYVNKNDVVAMPRWIHKKNKNTLPNNLEGIVG